MQRLIKSSSLGAVFLMFIHCLQAQPNITRVEYFIDTDPGMGLATVKPITPGTDLANQTISFDPTALTPGVHFLGIRSRNANGAWSHTNYLAFAKAFPALPAEPDRGNLNKIEYFIDNDPGMGMGIPIAFTTGNNLTNTVAQINVTGLAAGTHMLGWRSRQANGAWSHTFLLEFSVLALLAAPALEINSISKTTLCAGDSFYVGYHATGTYNTGNTFKVFLSDGVGSFVTETEIGTLTSNTKGGIVPCKLPAHFANGTSYRLRLKSSNTVLTGQQSMATLTIRDRPYAPLITGRTQVNGGFTYPYNVSAVAGSSFKWLINGGSQSSGTNTNAVTALWGNPTSDSINRNLKVIETNQYGCVGDTGLLAPITVYRLDIGDTTSASACKGDILVVKASITGSFDAGNILTAQLSNASGNFTAPTATTTLAYAGSGVNQLASFNLPIPANLPNGNGYRVRIRSSNPVFVGDTTAAIIIQKPALGADVTGTFCTGASYDLTQHFTDNALTYSWFNQAFVAVNNPAAVLAGIYQVIGKNSFGCPDTAMVTITALPKPALGADTTVYHVCAGDRTNLLPLYNTTSLTAVWNTGNPSSVGPGNYRLIVTNSQGCKDTALANIILPTAVWTGTVSTNWHTAGNWDNGKVPDATTHVIISTAIPRICIISASDGMAASVQLKNGATLQQTNGRQLIINEKCAALPTQ